MTRPRRERGMVLLLAILFLLVASSYLLVSKLSTAATQSYRNQQTAKMLSKAKEALLGLAASYPDQYPGQGPGQLPCPDTNNNGSPDPPCGTLAEEVRIGRLPTEFFGMEDLRDSSKELLWYAVSGRFRNNPKTTPLNSDTGGQLSVDGTGDIVAVIFGPGVSLSGQNRPSNTVSDYLEGANSDGDADFVTSAAGDFNDRLLAVTRKELMGVVEKRVLGEIDHSLASYRVAFNAYPWLAPFQPPDTSDYKSLPLTSAGHLPIHIADGEVFAATFSATWSIAGGNTSDSGPLPPDESCVRNSTCTDPLYGPINDPITGTICTWRNVTTTPPRYYGRDTLGCVAELNLGTVTRRYEVFYSQDGVTAAIVAPTAGSTRTREFHLNGNLPNQPGAMPGAITVTDTDNTTGSIVGQRQLNFTGGASGALDITGIPYDLDLNTYAAAPTGPEIPPWLVTNQWHHLAYVAYAASESPPGGVTACTPGGPPGTECIVLNGSGAPNDNKRALVLMAGRDLGFGAGRPSNDLAAYFEGQNRIQPNDTFERQQPLNDLFNDQVRVITTAP